MRYVFIAVAAYLLGSVCFAIIISKRLFRADVRTQGSGNAGATNMARVYGLVPGLAVLLCDALKTAAACLLGSLLGGPAGLCVAGCFCNVGHCWPAYYSFRGGKGVSVAAALVLITDWRVFLILLGIFFLVFFWKRTVSLCSVTVAVLFPLLCAVFKLPAPKIILAAFTALLVVWQHRSNLERLKNGTEGKFTPGKRTR